MQSPELGIAEGAASAVAGLERVSDEALVASYLAGDRRDDEIFREIFRRRREDVWRVCYSYLGNRQDAEDLTQEVFFTVYRKLPQFRGQASLRTWLFRITSNLCRNELRRRSRRPRVSETPLGEEAPVEASRETVEDEVVRKLQGHRLGRAMALMKPAERHLLWLAEFEGRAYGEIAEELGLSVGAVKMRVMRARLALKDAYGRLAREGPDDERASDTSAAGGTAGGRSPGRRRRRDDGPPGGL